MGLVDRALSGDQSALARLLTLVENDDPLGRAALETLYPRSGRAHRIGITGPPGAGKSTLVNCLIAHYRAAGKRVGVVAVDPTSRLSGGATLGDRIRLMDFHADPGVFVRSMASRGQRGGVSATTAAAAHVLDAVGYDPIMIETLGVGQDEVDVSRLVDTTLLVQVPGLGDAVQTLKAGIMEIGDVIAVNKSDLPGAETLARDLRTMLGLGGHSEEGWQPSVVTVSAASGEGVDKLVGFLSAHADFLSGSDELRTRRRDAAASEIEMLLRRRMERDLRFDESAGLGQLVEAVAARRQTAASVVGALSQTLAESTSLRPPND